MDRNTIKGIVVEINKRMGYGFVRELDSGQHFRFDIEETNDHLIPETKVVFRVIDLDPGKMAVNIQLSAI